MAEKSYKEMVDDEMLAWFRGRMSTYPFVAKAAITLVPTTIPRGVFGEFCSVPQHTKGYRLYAFTSTVFRDTFAVQYNGEIWHDDN